MKRSLIALALLAPSIAYATDGITITDVLTTSTTVAGQPITVPANPKLHISTYRIAPGARLPIHKHPFARYAYIEQGELDVTLVDSKKTLHFKAGEAFAEVIGGWHYGVNNGTVPVTLIVIDQTPQAVESNTVKQ